MTRWIEDRAFWCRCGAPTCAAPRQPAEALLVKLDLLHFILQRPLTILSGLHCHAFHAAAHGAPGSGHLDGTAACLAVASDKERWHLLAAIFGSDPPMFSQVGLGVGRLHVGVAPGKSAWLNGLERSC
jgi:hypothetical protein